MEDYSDKEIRDGISNEDQSILRYLYRRFFPSIRQFIEANNGCQSDAEDVFQEALVVVFVKIRDQQLELTSSFSTYLFAICKHIWLKQLRRGERYRTGENKMPELSTEENDDVWSTFIQNEKRKLCYQHIEALSSDCKRIIRLFIDGLSITEVAQIMKHKSEQHTKNRRLRCKEMLIRRISNDPRYKELRHDSIRQNTGISRW